LAFQHGDVCRGAKTGRRLTVPKSHRVKASMPSALQLPRIGIDLVPAGLRHRTAGTARLVEEQARALFALDVPWKWIPVIEGAGNPLFGEVQHLNPVVQAVDRLSVYTSFDLGRLWSRSRCALGFATAGLVPFGGPPVVANFFDANPYEEVDSWWRQNQRLRTLWMRFLYGRSVRTSRKLFILSEYGRRRMSEVMPRHAHKFIVTPCGISEPGTSPTETPAWAVALGRPFFLFVGSFSDNKNQRTLLRAWAQLQAERNDAPALVLMGPCPPEYRAAVLDSLHRALPRPDQVLMLGFAPEHELVWAYRHALAYLQPSIAEGFGLPVIEAMSYDLPVACSNTTSLPETAGDAALLFDPRQPSQIAAAAKDLWLDEPVRAGLIRRGRERAAKFRWRENARIVAGQIQGELEEMGLPTASGNFQ
jgi:glycosyltransferase involved in cell wall biosynthesis